MTEHHEQDVVSADWLAEHLDDDDLRIVDATWFLPSIDRDGAEEYLAGHIPGAVFWDIDAIADPSTSLPHMLPDPLSFMAAMEGLGIGDDTMVVVYDSHGLMTAARPWWMLRHFGHDRVAVLDGGLPNWLAEGRPLTVDAPAPREARFSAGPRPRTLRSLLEVHHLLETGGEQLVDARSVGRFNGNELEPRPNCRSGHMPGAINLPFNLLLDPDTKCLLPPDQLRSVLAEAGIDPARKITTTCGSGVTACVLALGMRLAGCEFVAVYDGSWSEWGTRDDVPVETG